MDSPPPSPIDRQLDALRVALTALYGGRAITEVLVRVEGIDRPVRVPFPGEPVQTPAPAPAEPPELSDLPELAQEIVQALRENGGWMTGAEIATAIGGDCDHTSGTWFRTTKLLRELEWIDSDRNRGYALKSS